MERRQPDHDVGQFGRIGREVGPQRGHVRQLPGLKRGGKFVGQFALAAPLVGERQQIDHEATGLPLRQPGQEHLEGAPVGVTGKELVSIDQAEQRHRLLAQRMDDMAVVHDLVMLAGLGTGPTAPAGS